MQRPDPDIAKALDRVVGTDYDSLHARGAVRRRLLKWALGVVAAIAIPAAIFSIIEAHRLPPQMPAKKPVQVQILPAK